MKKNYIAKANTPMFDNIFDLADKKILHDSLLSYGRIWKNDYRYFARIKNLFNYLGFNVDEFKDVKVAYSYEEIVKEFNDERKGTEIS